MSQYVVRVTTIPTPSDPEVDVAYEHTFDDKDEAVSAYAKVYATYRDYSAQHDGVVYCVTMQETILHLAACTPSVTVKEKVF